MNALIIGYGSIGKRHYEVLGQIDLIEKIDIVTAQMLTDITTFKTLADVENLDGYDYFVIASETSKHFEQIEYLENHTKNKTILCEKPLFDEWRDVEVKNNSIYVGYVLRFHPLIQEMRSMIKEETILSAQIICGSYLPTWRPGSDYRKSYSASKKLGGGVLLDLSHEIDYAQWLFGAVSDICSMQSKVSDLEIDSDDLVVATGKTEKGVVFGMSLDYISKVPMRELNIHTNEKTIRADLIHNTMIIGTKDGSIEVIDIAKFDRNDLFLKMHLAALGNKESLCTLTEALCVMKTISIIQGQNNG